ncbi:MAG: cupin domain-containing protein [Planctomycetota bacterium]
MANDSVYVDSSSVPWRDTPFVGVSWKKLLFDRETGRSAVLVKFEPGAVYDVHRHPAGEEYQVLEGSLEDGGRTRGAGTWVSHPPGSVHRPSSKEGCVLFISLPEPVEPLSDDECREFLGLDR